MKTNLLNQWKKEFYWNSSNLNPDKFCERNDIEKLENVLLQYFGEDYFEVTINQNESLEKSNWIFFLLAQKDISSLIALFEIGNIIEYLQTLDEGIQKKLKSAINSYKEFQNLFFEIYTYRILDFNKIENDKKVWKGNQELEGKFKIAGKEFIFECRKSYTVDFDRFDTILSLTKQIYLEMQKLKSGGELIGYIRIKKDVKKAKKKILNILSQFFGQFGGKQDFYIRSYHDDDDCQFETMIYDEKRYFELENQEDRPDITFKGCVQITVSGQSRLTQNANTAFNERKPKYCRNPKFHKSAGMAMRLTCVLYQPYYAIKQYFEKINTTSTFHFKKLHFVLPKWRPQYMDSAN